MNKLFILLLFVLFGCHSFTTLEKTLYNNHVNRIDDQYRILIDEYKIEEIVKTDVKYLKDVIDELQEVHLMLNDSTEISIMLVGETKTARIRLNPDNTIKAITQY